MRTRNAEQPFKRWKQAESLQKEVDNKKGAGFKAVCYFSANPKNT